MSISQELWVPEGAADWIFGFLGQAGALISLRMLHRMFAMIFHGVEYLLG